MTERYRLGSPIETCAVTENLPILKKDIPFFSRTEDNGFILKLDKNDIVYGLGEQVRGINKRGWKYTSCSADNCNHQEDTNSLYGTHNFFIVSGSVLFGVFFDYAGTINYDIGYANYDTLHITADDYNMDVYIITGAIEKDIVKEFRSLIGRSYIAPKWAFGYGQSRWGYKSAEDIRNVANEYKKRHIPLDSIYLDIDYMERFKDFTVNEQAFPDFADFCAEMKKEGIHLVPIIDAGVKIESGYDVYEEGVKNNFFCKDKDGNDFVGAVWPGRVHFPDFFKPETREWFGSKYSFLIEKGVEGFWNDMNEPAIFFTDDRLESVINRVNELSKSDMGIYDYFEFTGIVAGISNNIEDYKKFFHTVNGERIPHNKVHNLYGYNMTKAAGEAFESISPEKRILMYSRSSCIGAHRYGGIWQGDNKSWWSHLLMNFQMMPSLNMAGFLYTGADLGGFGSDTTEDLMLRWLQLGVFTPLMRNHSALGTREQELYRFDNCDDCKKMVEIRYGLIPYIYSEYMKAVLKNEMMFRPLSFDFRDDEMVKSVEDQLLLGDELMLAPVYTQNAVGRYVYLPEEMKLVRMRSLDDYDTEILTKGHHYVKADLNELIFFIRKGKAIPVGKSAENTALLCDDTLVLMGYDGTGYALYSDDGISKNYSIDDNLKIIK